MAIKIGEATFENLHMQEGEPVRIEMLRPVESIVPHHPVIASGEEAQQCFHYYPVFSARFEKETEGWKYLSNDSCASVNVCRGLLVGERFKETENGIVAVHNGIPKRRISNATIRIVSLVECWKSESEVEVYLRCSVCCPEAWGDTKRELDVPKNQYKATYRFIHRQYPEVSLSVQEQDALEAYLTSVAQRDLVTLPRKIEAVMMGWLKAGDIRYHMGTDKYYSGHHIPDVMAMDRTAVFQEANAFCEIGHGNVAIDTIWLFAHTAFSLYWFRQASSDLLRSVLFIKGTTNLMKSSLIRVLADVFRKDRLHASMPLSSTPAAIQSYMLHLKDNLVCLDDFSNTSGARNNDMIRNAETVIRAVGDSAFSGKMSLSDFSKLKADSVRCQVVITGEDELGLDASSLFRLIIVQFTKDTVDAELLRHFQEHPYSMSSYFALYIKFLTDMGETIIQHCKQQLEPYRRKYRDVLDVPRFIDAAVGFHLQADVSVWFAQYCGMLSEFCSKYHERMVQAVLEVLKTNQEVDREASPTLRFIIAFMQSVGTSRANRLAATESEYASNESAYIGFEDKSNGQLWVLFEAAIALVRAYYDKQGKSWLIRDTTLKELLLKEGFSVGKYAGPGKAGNQYLCRSRKGSRKRMLVLRTDKIEEFLADVSEGED